MSPIDSSLTSLVGTVSVRLALLAGCVLLAASCTMLSGPVTGEKALRQEVQTLQEKLEQGKGGAELHRELGTVYVRLGEADSARRHLERAHEQAPNDPKTIYFLGLAHERLDNVDRALNLFGQYSEVPSASQYREILQGRYDRLRRTKAREDIHARAQGQVDTSEVSPQTVAVFPLAFQGSDSTYAPIGRGLGELVLADLSNVGRLQVVERIRLQALFNEMELAQSEYVDPSTAPRVGRLLGAGRLVGGAYDVGAAGDNEKRITVNLSIVNLAGVVQSPGTESATGELSDLFDLQKEMVFDLVERLGIELTAEERTAIEEVPTRNLEAFLAYSRGLFAEDGGQYGLAARRYQRATQLDPGFSTAAQGVERTRRLKKVSDGEADALAARSEAAPIDLKELRHDNLAGQAPPLRQPLSEQTVASKNLLEGVPPLPSSGGSQ